MNSLEGLTTTQIPHYLEASEPKQLIAEMLGRINGKSIEKSLIRVAEIGGEAIDLTADQQEFYQQDVRFAANRLALSESDFRARNTIIKPLMEEAGMKVLTHPLGLIGIYEGSNPELVSPVVIASHTDSVPKGDMYDGVLGVVGGIAAVRAMKDSGVRPKRSIMVLSFTGEESSRFNFALFGSRSFFHGLSDEELASQRANDISLGEALGANVAFVQDPIFGPNGNTFPKPFAAIELHVDQTGFLEREKVDLGVVEAIAAPERHVVVVGDRVIREQDKSKHAEFLQLVVHGRADHSGATPMGDKWRADGLVKTADVLLPLLYQQCKEQVPWFSLGEISVAGQAMNKIPGETKANIKISASSESELLARKKEFEDYVQAHSLSTLDETDNFGKNPLALGSLMEEEAGIFFVQDEIMPRQITSFELAQAVSDHATAACEQEVVGTIGTYKLGIDGIIQLGLDVRGIDLHSREVVMGKIQNFVSDYSYSAGVNFGDALSGSGEPVMLDVGLVQKAGEIIKEYEIGISKKIFSPASHDAQNIARAGIPTVMLFCQSNHGGIAHNPDAYTAPNNMEKGVKALTVLAWDLANTG